MPAHREGADREAVVLDENVSKAVASDASDAATGQVDAGGGQLTRADTAAFVLRLRGYAEASVLGVETKKSDTSDDGSTWTSADRTAASLFRWDAPVVVARAPGRMDVMGGIADYSGSLVLQMPIAEACHVALQVQPKTHHVDHHDDDDEGTVTVVSPAREGAASERAEVFEMGWRDLLGDLGGGGGGGGGDVAADAAPRRRSMPTYAEARAWFARDASTRWAAYVAGVFLVLAREMGVDFAAKPSQGVSSGSAGAPRRSRGSVVVFVDSAVPEGKGVSSSAAVEVATMCAVAAAYDVHFPDDGGRRLAMLCQKVENLVVGAPCGVMDQMASACGKEGTLLSLLCRPAEVKGHLALPPHAAVWGVDSGVRHSVGGSDYGRVRTGAFMGRTMVRAFYGRDVQSAHPDGVLTHLTEIPPHVFESPAFAERLPPEGCYMDGGTFLARFPEGHGDDGVTSVDPGERYEVTGPTRHPVLEHHRVRAFAQALCASAGGGLPAGCYGTTAREAEDEQLSVLGELMYQSDAAYRRLGLGSDGTDEIVRLVKSLGPSRGLFGAKITGGGSGGTVCVLGRSDGSGEAAVAEVCEAYKRSTGRTPYVFRGSSVGAVEFGHVWVRALPP